MSPVAPPVPKSRFGFKIAKMRMLRDVVCARQTFLARRRMLAMTIKNGGHGSMSMELRERAFHLRELRC